MITPDAKGVARVSLIRLGAFTHANNWGQRFMWLDFDFKSDKSDRTKGKLVVQAPLNANLAPPGFYMLFVLNADNVPSVGAYVCMGAGRLCGS